MKKILISVFVSFLLMLSPQTQAKTSEIDCLALLVYKEARGESTKGKEAVAQVVFNRMKDKRFPNTACAVMKQPFQFSFWLKPNESMLNLLKGSTKHLKPLDLQAYLEARQIAKKAFYGLPEHNPRLENSLYFVHKSITSEQQPWLKKLKKKATIGNHKFY